MQNTPDAALFVKMVTDYWTTQNNRVTKLVETLSEDALMKETAPGRNRGVYLFGHLIAVNDALLPLLGFGEKLYPELGKIFLDAPDKSVPSLPSVSQLKKQWAEVNERLEKEFSKMSPSDWFAKHTAVSAENFEKEPHRNKLNVIINRTNHTSYHHGQLVYLQKKVDD
jgi:hypothetical protein